MSKNEFVVSINEITQNFVFGDSFSESYTKIVTLSDGTTRTIKLTPMVRKGRPVVELNDTGHITYMSPDGTKTNGKLMVQIHEVPEQRGKLPKNTMEEKSNGSSRKFSPKFLR